MDNSVPSLRVCQLISSFRPVIGGAERATERLSSVLRRAGVDVIVLTRRKTPGDEAVELVSGIPVYRLGQSNPGKWGALTYALRSLWMLATSLRSYRIVHAQSPDTPFLLGVLAKYLLGRKLVLTIHGGNRIRDYLKTPLGRPRLQLMRYSVDRFTAITQEVQEQLLSLGVPPSRIVMIPNGIETEQFAPPDGETRRAVRRLLNLPEAGQVVLFVGRLQKVKRVDVLLRAWASLPKDRDDTLVVVGGGPELEPLKALAAQLQIEVRFEGARQDVLPYLQASDIFVLPSGIRRTASYEGLSVALMEAMSAGLAALVSDCPGNRVLVRDGENGLLFPVEDVEALARQLTRLLDDADLRARLGQNARASVVREYAIDAVAQQTEMLYRDLVFET